MIPTYGSQPYEVEGLVFVASKYSTKYLEDGLELGRKIEQHI